MSSSRDKSIACIIEREHPIISRKSWVIDVLLWEARRQGKEEELWRIFKTYSQSMNINELDKAIKEIARLLGVEVVYKYI
ncbi:MAG: hypothetical protein LM567_07965 [Desulfurococcaceae archaeon]|nr:hypothetical protein [Desulfurococcaceae archaeon]